MLKGGNVGMSSLTALYRSVCSVKQLFSFWVLTVLTAVLSGQQTLANIIKTTWRDLNDPATLYCPEPCSGVETWERSGLKVAECGVKEESEFSSHNSSAEVPAGDPLILDLFTFHPVTNVLPD
ncbi:hypothetical protein SRHO_G00216080 [Serrasalmus rhombeus]